MAAVIHYPANDLVIEFLIHAYRSQLRDQRVNEQLRFVQLTPPGSACSIAFGDGLTTAAPGSVKVLQMVVADANAARKELMDRGLEVGDVDIQRWGSFVYFSDPDGNSWAVQEFPARS